MPSTRFFEKPLTLKAACAIASSGIRNDDDDAVRRVFHDLLDYRFDYVVVCLQQIVAAHAGLARKTGGDDHYVASSSGGVIAVRRGNADRFDVRARNRGCFHHVQRFAGGRAVENIRQHNVSEFHVRNALRRCGTYKSASDYRYFFSAHDCGLCPSLFTCRLPCPSYFQ